MKNWLTAWQNEEAWTQIYASWSNTCLCALLSTVSPFCVPASAWHGNQTTLSTMGIERSALGYSYVTTYACTIVLHRAHEPRSTCDVELIKSKLLLRASCMRQGRRARRRSKLRTNSPHSFLLVDYYMLTFIVSRFQFLRLRWQYADIRPWFHILNDSGNTFDDPVRTRLLCRVPTRSASVKHITKYNFSRSHVRPWGWKLTGGKRVRSGSAQISIETGSTVTTVILSAARAALIVLVPVGCSHS